MSHSSSCQHFASRTAQFDAAAGRWLAEAERKKVLHDPELAAV